MALTKVFSDSFTDTDGVLLTAHTPEQGLGWSVLAGSGGTNAQIDWDGSNGTLVQPFYNPSAYSWYVANTTESPSLTQQVEAVYRSSIVRLMLRASNGSAAPNGVIVEFSSSLSIVTIRTLSEGVQTQVATKPTTAITSGDVCRVLIDDSNDVYAWLNDVPIIWDSNGGNPNFNVASAPSSGQVGWIGVKSYTTNGTDSYDAWYDVASGPTTITFNGTIPNQQFTNGQSVNLDLSSYFSGTQTPFTASSIGTELSTVGLSLGTNFIITGTYNGSTLNGVQVRGTDNDLNTADSNTFNISLASTDVNVNIVDVLPSLTSTLSMTFIPSGVGTITISNWANNTGTPLPNLTGITLNVRSLVDGSTVYRTTTASTNGSADCVVSDAAIVTGTEYEVTALKFNGVDYDIGIAIITAT